MEAAGCHSVRRGTSPQRIIELSQWVDDYPVMLIARSTRPKTAHCPPLRPPRAAFHQPHGEYGDRSHRLRRRVSHARRRDSAELRRLDLGKLLELESRMGRLDASPPLGGHIAWATIHRPGSHQAHKAMNARGWKPKSQASESIVRKTRPTAHRHDTPSRGFTDQQAAADRRIRQSCGQSIPPEVAASCDLTRLTLGCHADGARCGHTRRPEQASVWRRRCCTDSDCPVSIPGT